MERKEECVKRIKKAAGKGNIVNINKIQGDKNEIVPIKTADWRRYPGCLYDPLLVKRVFFFFYFVHVQLM